MPINKDDFCWMNQGKHLTSLSFKDLGLLQPIVHYKKSHPKTRALLLFHGFSSSPAVYRYFFESIFNWYDGVFCPVLPGHGTNLNEFAKVTAIEWLEFSVKSYEQLAKEFQEIDVLGLSLGGILACHVSKICTLRHLYLLAPALDIRLAKTKILKLLWLLKLLGFVEIRSLAGNIINAEYCELAYRKLPLNTIEEILKLITNFEFVIPLCPTDVFLGRRDLVVKTKAVEKLLSNQNNVTIHWLENSAHVLPLDNDMDLILKCIKHNF